MTNTNKHNHEELKACPFCGSEGVLSETEGGDFVIQCDGCDAFFHDDMKWSENNYDARSNVIGKWNARAEETKNLRLCAEIVELRRELEEAQSINRIAGLHVTEVEQELEKSKKDASNVRMLNGLQAQSIRILNDDLEMAEEELRSLKDNG